MKRTRCQTDSTPSKRVKYDSSIIINYENWKVLDKKVDETSEWISATKTKNYLLKDPVLDWFDKYYFTYGFGDKNISKEKIKREKQQIANELQIMNNTLFRKGNEFEKLIYKEIEKRLGKNNCVDVINNYKECSIEKMNDTIKYMEKGIPIIRQAVLYNESNRTFGIADFLVRSDFINTLFDDEIEHIDKEAEHIGSIFSKNYHYRVVDIKWSQLQLCSDGFKILNSDRYPAYKGQLAIYNLALGKIQKYIPDTAYILGKSYKFEFLSENYYSSNSFDRMGHILFDDFDSKYIELTKEAIDWYRDMLENGNKWNLLKSTRKELYPNMCNSNDAPFTSIKQELAIKIAELTSIWKVGIKNREKAHSKNIFSWKDDNCSSENLGISKSLAPTIDNIININKNSDYIYSPNKLETNMFEWRDEKKYVDFYIDFETIQDVFYKDTVSITNNKSNNFIFMIGVGYFDYSNNWIFKEFHMDKLVDNEEIRIMIEFKQYVEETYVKMRQLSSSKIRFFHWSHAEVSFLENYNNKNNLSYTSFLNKIEFADLYKLFTQEKICINGALTYKLKDISKALYKHGLIQTTWNSTNVTNGLNAMLDGCYYYKCIDNNKVDDNTKNIFDNIIKYNEIDCKVMGDIVLWMRNCL